MYRRILSATVLVAATATLFFAPQRVAAQTKQAVPGSEPYSTLFNITITSGNGTIANSPNPVPANRRLVIEFVSIRVIVTPGEQPRFALQDSVNGASIPYILPLALAATGSYGEEWRTTQLVKLYHDGNGVNGPGADCGREQNSFSQLTCSIAISGYMIAK